MIAHPVTEPVKFFQWNGQPYEQWPMWVQRDCFLLEGEMIHDRQSGRQVVYPGEYLVRELDGAVVVLTRLEFERGFRRAS